MNKNTKVLALKYRPQTFNDLIGQDVVVTTILNSIKENKVPNAYLFTGIRGIGKTTIARIVAKSLNCLKGVDKLCKEDLCENCSAISESNHIDVLEMDAASKTGVDDVRDLIEFSRYGPTSSKYKIFIIDEVHMLSKQAFNALLKTLEEPPEYLKFIFATTEIKKIPITVVSRCQRFDLSRIKSMELLAFIKKILEKEKGKATEEALRLIVKISEGSVRDALSLLDRAIIGLDQGLELDLKTAQTFFGYFDKSNLIELFEALFDGNEKEVLKIYRNIYDQGVEPKIFLNDFLEILYYFKNINSLEIDGTNFSLNDEEFNKIKKIATNIKNDTLLLYWQFSINTLSEIDIVSNQNLSIEMFLIRLIYLKEIIDIPEMSLNEISKEINLENNISKEVENKKNLKKSPDTAGQTIGQIKNIFQEKKQNDKEILNDQPKAEIKTFNDLIKICELKKEIKLKYELERNVNLVNFEKQKIEISFNENLDKQFIKDLTSKLFEWTKNRWIILLSKNTGNLSIKEEQNNLKKQKLEDLEKSENYKKILEYFNDAELIDVKYHESENYD
jgi:DNA polymerase III subunit gamma/tau